MALWRKSAPVKGPINYVYIARQ